MKKAKRLLALLLVIFALVVAAIIPASATYNNTGKTFTKTESGVTYTYKIFKDDASWYCMTGLNVTPIIYHTKNSGAKTLNFTIAKTYSSQTAYNFGIGLGITASAEIVSATASATGGMTQTTGMSVAASGAVGATVPTASNTGYYKMEICYNFDKFRLDKYNGSTILLNIYDVLPKGSAYVAVLYSSNNSSYAIW